MKKNTILVQFLLVSFFLFFLSSFSHAKIIFEEGFEDGIVPYGEPGTTWKPVGMDSSTIVNSISREGAHAIKFHLIYDDTDTESHSEFRLNRSDVREFLPGSEHWYSFSVFLPKDYKYSGNTTIITQFFANPDTELGEIWNRNPPFLLATAENEWLIMVRADSNPVTVKGNYAVSRSWTIGKWDIGKWTDFTFHVKWSYKEDGILKVWKNGQLVLDYKGPNCYNDKNGVYWNIGIYEHYWNNGPNLVSERLLYYDSIRIGDSNSSYTELSINGQPVQQPVSSGVPEPPSLYIKSTAQN